MAMQVERHIAQANLAKPFAAEADNQIDDARIRTWLFRDVQPVEMNAVFQGGKFIPHFPPSFLQAGQRFRSGCVSANHGLGEILANANEKAVFILDPS